MSFIDGENKPGIKEDNLRFASSRVFNFSSVVRGTLGGLSVPSGHSIPLKVPKRESIRSSPRKDLTTSLSFLAD
jgi:hypothetical protein